MLIQGNSEEFESDFEDELAEAERMVRNGMSMRQIRRKQFTYLGQSDIFKLYKKFGRDFSQEGEEAW